TLLQALGGAGAEHAEIFIGPNMQRMSGAARGGGGDDARGAGGGGAGGGAPDFAGGGIGAMLSGPGGLGFLLRGIGMPGAMGGMGMGLGMGPGGNVGDYAFGDLSQLIQQLMAADTNRHGPPPASKKFVENLPTIIVAKGSELEGQECAVCKDEFAAGDKARELPCQHSFHEQCILPWVAERNTCPTCRHELPTDDSSSGSGSGSSNNNDNDNNGDSGHDANAGGGGSQDGGGGGGNTDSRANSTSSSSPPSSSSSSSSSSSAPPLTSGSSARWTAASSGGGSGGGSGSGQTGTER
ncbi:unnamed protein product, partial [Ectocarpus sp. 12 AP-2014]